MRYAARVSEGSVLSRILMKVTRAKWALIVVSWFGVRGNGRALWNRPVSTLHQLSFSNVNKCQKMFKCLNFRARNGHIIYVDFWRENSNVYNLESFPFCLNICSTLSRFPLLRVFVLHRGKRERKSHPRSKSLLLTEFSAATFHSRASICSEL